MTKEKWEQMTLYKVYKAKNLITGEKVRISREDTTGFEYAKGKRRYGHRYGIDFMLQNYELLPEKDENAAWHKRLDRATKCLEKSGLWPEYKALLESLKQMDWYDKETINSLYWANLLSSGTPIDEHNSTFENVFSKWEEKYPFAFFTDGNGKKQLKTDYFWEVSECKLKSMYFGKKTNDFKEDIYFHLRDKRDYSIPRIRTNYDVSFEYRPDKNKAWYSEEYKGCGNGHYYIALDHNTALFVEDD